MFLSGLQAIPRQDLERYERCMSSLVEQGVWNRVTSKSVLGYYRGGDGWVNLLPKTHININR